MSRNCQDCGRFMNRQRIYHNARCCYPCYERRLDATWAAIKATRRAIRKGLVPRITPDTKCVDCGDRAFGYDHRDYSDPINVDPVCRSCNWKRGPAKLPRAAA